MNVKDSEPILHHHGFPTSSHLNREVLTPYTAPFESPAARKALIKE